MKTLTLIAAAGIALSAIASAQSAGRIEKTAIAADPTLREALSHRRAGVWDKQEPVVPFVVSASGGISLGAYQAGVSWSIMRVLRRMEADSFFRRDTLGLGQPRLWAATGASAGNINALLSALEWCTPTPTAPEESLFWKVWVSVGWPELFPEKRDSWFRLRQSDHGAAESVSQGDGGVLDRAFFKKHIFPELERRMKGATRSQCDALPIGITTTRVEPISFPVTKELSAVTQRYASIFELRDHPTDSGLVFAQARSSLRDRGMGALLAPAIGATELIPPKDVFTLIEASSAFPIAFSPRLLRYYEASSLRTNGYCPEAPSTAVPCAAPKSAYFTDGGVFDNNPLQLALDIYGRTSNVVHVLTPGFSDTVTQFTETPARALYVGVDLYRNAKLRPVNSADEAPDAIGGIGAIFTLLGGAVPAARQYEMQTLARSLARDRVMPGDFIRTTDRYFPLFGDHFAAFGAFLGRPLREWDFYVGMYDGLHFVATDVICSEDGFQIKNFDGQNALDDCVSAWMRWLVGARTVELGPVAPWILSELLSFEENGAMGNINMQPRHLDKVDGDRLRVLRSLSRAQAAHITRVQAWRGDQSLLRCTSKDWARRSACSGGLDRLMQSIRDDAAALKIINSWKGTDECTKTNPDPIHRPCLADATFADFVANPAEEIKHRVGHIANRLLAIERAVAAGHNPAGGDSLLAGKAKEYSKFVKLAEFLLRSTDWPARRKADLDPSSIPPESALLSKRRFAQLFPYHWSGGIGLAGYEVGVTPLYHFGERFALQLPISLSRMNEAISAGETARTNQVQPGIGLLFKTGGILMPAFGAAVRPTTHLIRDHQRRRVHASTPDMMQYELNAYLLAGKLRLSAYRVPDAFASDRRWGMRAGLSDIPGIVYWVWR